MADKKAPSVSNRRTFYWTAEMENALLEVAKAAKAAGFEGMFDDKGEINRAAVMRHMINMTERVQHRPETKWG